MIVLTEVWDRLWCKHETNGEVWQYEQQTNAFPAVFENIYKLRCKKCNKDYGFFRNSLKAHEASNE